MRKPEVMNRPARKSPRQVEDGYDGVQTPPQPAKPETDPDFLAFLQQMEKDTEELEAEIEELSKQLQLKKEKRAGLLYQMRAVIREPKLPLFDRSES